MRRSIMVLVVLLGGLTALGVPESPSEKGEIAGLLCGLVEETGQKMFLPLKKTDVAIKMSAGVIDATVTQTFVNDTAYPLEAIYVFPLPSRASVTGMELRVGDRIIRSVVKERAEAKKVYEQAKKEGKKAALLEQERPNIFTTSVANFLPGETVQVSLSYMEPSEYTKGLYSMNYPMVVGQRYIPFKVEEDQDGSIRLEKGVPDGERLNPPLLHPAIDPSHRLSMRVEIQGLPIEKVVSTTHAISVDQTDNSAVVTLAKEVTIPDSDFNLRIHLREKKVPHVSLVSSTEGDRGFGLLTVFPPTTDRKSKKSLVPRDVVFLIDTSGSMSGESIGQAKTGLKECMKMLRTQDRFTIVRFASEFSHFSPDLRDATPEKVAQAERYVDGLSSGGGTEMQKALDYVLSIPDRDGRLKLIVFMTDGDVGNEDSLMKLLGQKLGKGRIFSFAIGSAPNEYLMRKMAELGRGAFSFIHSHEDIDEVMSTFFKTLEAPVLTDVEISWRRSNGSELEDVAYYPSPCPDVFYERPLQVVAEYPAHFKGSVRIRGVLDGKKVEYSYFADGDDLTDSVALSKLFGRASIDDLMCGYIQANNPDERGLMKDEVIRVALKHQLVSKFTSRVAVEEVVERNPDGTLLSVKVKTPLPKGWSAGAFFPTATNDTLLLMVGAATICVALFIKVFKKRAARAFWEV